MYLTFGCTYWYVYTQILYGYNINDIKLNAQHPVQYTYYIYIYILYIIPILYIIYIIYPYIYNMPLYIIYTYLIYIYIYVIIQHRIYSSFNPLETFRHWVKPPSFEL